MYTYCKGIIIGLVALLAVLHSSAADAVWQWSVPTSAGRAYLWLPEKCKQVRAMVLRATFPIKLTVVAWQWGRATEPKVQFAAPVERTIEITR